MESETLPPQSGHKYVIRNIKKYNRKFRLKSHKINNKKTHKKELEYNELIQKKVNNESNCNDIKYIK